MNTQPSSASRERRKTVMAVSDTVIKEHLLYINTKANLEEACDHIRDLETDLDQYLAELKYLYDFVKYRELEEDFRFFRENAHLDSKKDLPFPSYVL